MLINSGIISKNGNAKLVPLLTILQMIKHTYLGFDVFNKFDKTLIYCNKDKHILLENLVANPNTYNASVTDSVCVSLIMWEISKQSQFPFPHIIPKAAKQHWEISRFDESKGNSFRKLFEKEEFGLLRIIDRETSAAVFCRLIFVECKLQNIKSENISPGYISFEGTESIKLIEGMQYNRDWVVFSSLLNLSHKYGNIIGNVTLSFSFIWIEVPNIKSIDLNEEERSNVEMT